jgi:Fe-S oxidoreductase
MAGAWGARAEHADLAQSLAVKLGDEVRRADGDAVAGDCHLANTVISEQTGESPLHPIQLLARAYGISPEPGR